MEVKDLSAIYYSKEKVLEVYLKKKLLKTVTVGKEEEEWTGISVGKEEFDLNIVIEGEEMTIGVYSCNAKVGKWGNEIWETGEFLDVLAVKIQ